MGMNQLPFHESFERTQALAEGNLLLSESYADIAIREALYTTHVDDRISRLVATTEQVQALEKAGIETVHPRPVVTKTGLAFVCDKVNGNPLNKEIDEGNNAAKMAYGGILLGLTKYYSGNIKDPKTPVLEDIVAPNQFTWQAEKTILHDISTVGYVEHKIPSIALNICQIAYEYARLNDSFDENTSINIIIELKEIISLLECDISVNAKYVHFLNLAVSISEELKEKAFQSLVAAYELDAFES